MNTDGPDAVAEARASRQAACHAASAAAGSAAAGTISTLSANAEAPHARAAGNRPPPPAQTSENVLKSIAALCVQIQRTCELSVKEGGQTPSSISAGLTLTATHIGLVSTLRDAERELGLERAARSHGAAAPASVGQVFVEAPGAVPGFSTKRLKPAIEGGFGRGSRGAGAERTATAAGEEPASQPFVQVHKQPRPGKKRQRSGGRGGRGAAAGAAAGAEMPASGVACQHLQRSAPQQETAPATQQRIQTGSTVLGVPGEHPPQFISAGERLTWSSI